MNKFIILIITIAALVTNIYPCNADQNILGKWQLIRIDLKNEVSKTQSGEIEFRNDKTVLFPDGKEGKWTILKDGRVEINLNGKIMIGFLQGNYLKLMSPNAPDEISILQRNK